MGKRRIRTLHINLRREAGRKSENQTDREKERERERELERNTHTDRE